MLHGMNEYGTEIYGSAFPGTSTKFYIGNHSNERPFSMTFGSVTIHLTDVQARTFYSILRDELCKRDATASAEYELQAGLREAYAVRDVDEDYEAAFADMGSEA